MSKRTMQNIQDDFNKLGSELLQVELGIERLKDALTKANNDKNRSMQKLVALDNEFQKLKYDGLKVQENANAESPKDQVEAAPSAPTEPPAAG